MTEYKIMVRLINHSLLTETLPNGHLIFPTPGAAAAAAAPQRELEVSIYISQESKTCSLSSLLSPHILSQRATAGTKHTLDKIGKMGGKNIGFPDPELSLLSLTRENCQSRGASGLCWFPYEFHSISHWGTFRARRFHTREEPRLHQETTCKFPLVRLVWSTVVTRTQRGYAQQLRHHFSSEFRLCLKKWKSRLMRALPISQKKKSAWLCLTAKRSRVSATRPPPSKSPKASPTALLKR